MAGRGRKKHPSFSTQRIRIKQQAANYRIYKMVRKAVHQELATQNLDHFMIQQLTFMEHLTKIQGDIIMNLQAIDDWLGKILKKVEKESSNIAEHEGYSLPTKTKQEDRSKTLLDVSERLDTSDVSSHTDTTLQLADREQDKEQQVFLTDISAPPDHLLKNPEPKREEEEEELLEIPNQKNELMATQWRERMDKQEERRKYVKGTPAVAQKTEKQEKGALSVLWKQEHQTEKAEGNLIKVTKFLVNLVTPDSSVKYQQFEDED